MEPDTTRRPGVQITNPVDGSALNKRVINVRGRAEVGATVKSSSTVWIKGSDVAHPPVPNDGLGGRFTVESVDLGAEGLKEIRGSRDRPVR